MFDDLARRERFENDFRIFLDALQHAIALIEPQYFQLPVAQLEYPVYRERVYCYELYHRLREALPGEFGYRFDTENAVVKAQSEIKDLPTGCFYLLTHSQPLSPAEIAIRKYVELSKGFQWPNPIIPTL